MKVEYVQQINVLIILLGYIVCTATHIYEYTPLSRFVAYRLLFHPFSLLCHSVDRSPQIFGLYLLNAIVR